MRILIPLAASALLACASHPGQGAGRLVPEAASVDFGAVPVGASVIRTVEFSLLDSSPQQLTIDPGSVPADLRVIPGMRPLEPEGTRTVTLTFAPRMPGPLSGDVVLRAGPHLARIKVTGTAVDLLLDTDPPAGLDFGPVMLGSATSLPLMIHNPSSALQTFYLSTSDPAFKVDPGMQAAQPGASLSVAVTYRPRHRGRLHGDLQFSDCLGCAPAQTRSLDASARIDSFEVSPSPLDFGTRFPGRVVCQDLTLRNTGDLPIALASVDADEDFRSGVFALHAGNLLDPGTTLDVGSTASAEVCFTPSALGKSYSGSLLFHALSGAKAGLEVTGRGGGLQIQCTPDPLPLVATPVFPARQTVTCTNLGESEDVVITSLRVSNVNALYLETFRDGDPKGFNLGRADYHFDVILRAAVPGSYGESLTLVFDKAGDTEADTLEIPVDGSVVDGAICNLDVHPLGLNFGVVAAGTSTERTMHVVNLDPASSCILWGFELQPVYGRPVLYSGFALSAPQGITTLAPGGSLDLTMQYTPATVDDEVDLAFGRVSAPGVDPILHFPIAGYLGIPLTVTPQPIDFGTVQAGRPMQVEVTLTNERPVTVDVGSIPGVSPGGTIAMSLDSPPVFSVKDLPDVWPLAFDPGDSLTFAVALAAPDPGHFEGDLEIWLEESGASIRVPVRAEVVR